MPAWMPWLLLNVLALIGATREAQRVVGWLAFLAERLAAIPCGPEVVVFLVALGLGGLPSFLNAVPPPSTHDEFAYLLAADTFAHGRLTNPPHQLWEHFETFHEIMQPTYAAKFPPAQGVALLTGRLLGAPIIGAWGTDAIACAAMCWMIRG